MIGCGGGPAALRPPALDPEQAAAEAIALYDTDGDEQLSESELEACPGLKLASKAYDLDGDSAISQAEIAARLQRFIDRGVALYQLSARVRLDNKPLASAAVRFVPEPYLGEEIKVATGTTRPGGSASMAVPDEDLPKNQQGIRGIHAGTYRVEVTHPEIAIPAKYNTETTLGYETTPGNPYAKFNLSTR